MNGSFYQSEGLSLNLGMVLSGVQSRKLRLIDFQFSAIRRHPLVYLFILFIYYWFYIPPTCANTSERSVGSRTICLGPSRVLSCASDRQFLIERQVCRLSTKPHVSTALHYTITVCCNRTAHSQHCLLASVDARELNLKCARATGELNPGLFALAAD